MWEAVLGYYIHMVYLVKNYTTTRNEGKVVQKKSSKDEKRGLSSFNLVQIQVGRIMKQQAFLGGKKLFDLRLELAPITYCQQKLGSWLPNFRYCQQTLSSWLPNFMYCQQTLSSWLPNFTYCQQTLGSWLLN